MGKRWQELDLPLLVKHHAALFFFTAEAFHYYLPAFLMVSIKFYDQSENISGSVIFSLTPPESDRGSARADFLSKMKFFNIAQKNAVREFLEFMRNEHGEDFPCAGPTKALTSYWNDNVS